MPILGMILERFFWSVPNSVKILFELDNLRQDDLHIFEGQNEIPPNIQRRILSNIIKIVEFLIIK